MRRVRKSRNLNLNAHGTPRAADVRFGERVGRYHCGEERRPSSTMYSYSRDLRSLRRRRLHRRGMIRRCRLTSLPRCGSFQGPLLEDRHGLGACVEINQ